MKLIQEKSIKFFRKYTLPLVSGQICAGVAGSLYFSEVMHLPPCILCVYQRMLLYPLVIIIVVGLFLRDKKLHFYILPFSILGMIVSLYHNLIYWHIIPESLTPCSVQLPCTVRDFSLFGFVSIPLMSFLAFTFITTGVILHSKLSEK